MLSARENGRHFAQIDDAVRFAVIIALALVRHKLVDM